jgi:hypothetical protein
MPVGGGIKFDVSEYADDGGPVDLQEDGGCG